MLEGVDDHLDAMGIRLKEEFYCANCIAKMREVASSTYKCGKCGTVFEDR